MRKYLIFLIIFILSTLIASAGDSTTDCWDAGVNPHPVCSCDDLQNMSTQLTWNYSLQNDVDFSLCDASYTSGTGWTPIGSTGTPFTGGLDGQGYNISNLYINDAASYVGFFGYGSNANTWIENIGFLDINLTVDGNYVGGLFGLSIIQINNTFVTGNINFTGGQGCGGLVGANRDNIYNSWTNVNITTDRGSIGGISGLPTNAGARPTIVIENVYSTGKIDCTTLGSCGGITGTGNDASGPVLLNNTYSSSTITCGGIFCGGISGSCLDLGVYDSYYTGILNSSTTTVGGICGRIGSSYSIINSYSNATLIATNKIGGIAGSVVSGGKINNSFSASTIINTSIGNMTGGIVGFIDTGLIQNVYWLNNSNNPSNCWSIELSEGNENCTAITDVSYFYNVSSPPMDVWDFTEIWSNTTDTVSYPLLQMQVTTTTTTTTTSTTTTLSECGTSTSIIIDNIGIIAGFFSLVVVAIFAGIIFLLLQGGNGAISVGKEEIIGLVIASIIIGVGLLILVGLKTVC